MDSALAVHRLHFAFTVTFHYLFPQLTMGLALLIVILKTMALKTGNARYNDSARFWARIFAVTLCALGGLLIMWLGGRAALVGFGAGLVVLHLGALYAGSATGLLLGLATCVAWNFGLWWAGRRALAA